MRIYFEEHQYQATEEVLRDLRDICALQDVEKKISVGYVGYFYNKEVSDCIFILPKVLLTEKEVPDEDGKKIKIDAVAYVNGEQEDVLVRPEDIITPNGQKEHLTPEYRKFIYEFSVWIYRALSVYRNKSNTDRHALYYRQLPQEGRGKRREAESFLDIILSMIRFNRENQNFFTFTIKNLHSGMNKVNWTRTICHSQAYIQNESVVYLNPINKQRKVNFDEELFIIFFSILNFVNEKYGFNAPINCNYELVRGTQFETFAKRASSKLRQIKYKYFSDKTLRMWDLCYAFFVDYYKLAINTHNNEYLLAKNFEHVFEAMIDELIGNTNVPRGLKAQLDGKRVDHMFTYSGLTFSDDQRDKEIYYIGDSKYYKVGHTLGRESIYKQYTYARNVIQWNIDLFMEGQRKGWSKEEEEARLKDKNEYGKIRLRQDDEDPVTEGYNVIPNFFISAFIDDQRHYIASENIKPHPSDKDNPEKDDEGRIIPKTYISQQFPDRLFDRDTLILSHYDVNFLYVIYLYARDKQGEKYTWRETVRKIFQKEVRQVLERKYDFFALKSKGNPLAGEEFIKENFKDFQGKLYRPYSDKNLYAFAMEKREGGTKDSETYHLLEEFFEIKSVTLGENPKEKLEDQVVEYQKMHPYKPVPESWLPEYHIERYLEDFFVVGLYHDKEHWDWITGKNDKATLIYNIRLDEDRAGAMPKTRIRTMKPRFVILYEEGHEKENKYHVFRIHDTAVMSEERMRLSQYPTNHGGPKGDYFIFRFDDEIKLCDIDTARLINDWRKDNPDAEIGTPIFVKGEDLIKYRK